MTGEWTRGDSCSSSNILIDARFDVGKDFRNSFLRFKEELSKEGWILPTLEYNMRNQVNINNIDIKTDIRGQEKPISINKLGSGSSVVGEVPILFKVPLYEQE